MVVIGGVNPASPNASLLYHTQDIWPNGIGVFDLSAMQWADGYDASATDYVTPTAVKAWYEENGQYPSTWDDPVVEAYFVHSGKFLVLLYSVLLSFVLTIV